MFTRPRATIAAAPFNSLQINSRGHSPVVFIFLKLNTMKQAGIAILIIGVLITLFSGFTFVTKKKVVDIGSLEITKDEKHRIPWSPIVGGVVILIGGGMLIMGGKKA